jgi:hypothetical protein
VKGESAAAPNVATGFRLLYGSRHTSITITPLQGVAQACVSENAPAPRASTRPAPLGAAPTRPFGSKTTVVATVHAR